jgi:Fe-Mn family superoxide dismutase
MLIIGVFYMAYEVKNYDKLLGTKGFSDQLLKNHFTLYQGYVTNTNKVTDALSAMAREGKIATPEYAELKRRFGWEFNGMRLHEFYFENIIKGGKEIDKNTNLYKKIVADFGSYENWERDFKTTGAMRGIGWVILSYDGMEGRMFNTWINEHDVGHLCISTPLIVMDVFEHAYMIDYQLKKADYIEAFFKAIDWTIDPEMDSWIE